MGQTLCGTDRCSKSFAGFLVSGLHLFFLFNALSGLFPWHTITCPFSSAHPQNSPFSSEFFLHSIHPHPSVKMRLRAFSSACVLLTKFWNADQAQPQPQLLVISPRLHAGTHAQTAKCACPLAAGALHPKETKHRTAYASLHSRLTVELQRRH